MFHPSPTLMITTHPLIDILRKHTAGVSVETEVIGPGLVQMAHWNPEFDVVEIAEASEKFPFFRDFPTYGVCDTPEQFMEELGAEIEADPGTFIVTFVEIRRDEQPSDGGWRYHKWGEYIGHQNPEHEYLYHDKHIDRVFTFHVYQVTA